MSGENLLVETVECSVCQLNNGYILILEKVKFFVEICDGKRSEILWA